MARTSRTGYWNSQKSARSISAVVHCIKAGMPNFSQRTMLLVYCRSLDRSQRYVPMTPAQSRSFPRERPGQDLSLAADLSPDQVLILVRKTALDPVPAHGQPHQPTVLQAPPPGHGLVGDALQDPVIDENQCNGHQKKEHRRPSLIHFIHCPSSGSTGRRGGIPSSFFRQQNSRMG